MLTFQLNVILKKEGISQNEFSRLTNVRPNTINDIVNNQVKRLEIKTLNRILKTLYSMGYKIEDFMFFQSR